MRSSAPSDADPGAERPLDVLDSSEAGRKVVRGGALRITGFVVGTVIALLGTALVTRHLGPTSFGRFQTVLALVTIVQMITDLGMSPLGIREYSQRHGGDRSRFMAVLLGLRLATTLVGIVLTVLIAVALGYDNVMVAGTALLGAGVLLSLLQGTLSIPLMTQLRIGTTTALDLLRQVGQTLGYVLLVAAGAGLVLFFVVTIPVMAALVVATALLVRGVISLRPSFNVHEWHALIGPTLIFAVAVAANQIYVNAALVLTQLVASEQETGLFAASFRVIAVTVGVPGVLVLAAFPLLSRAAVDDRARLSYATARLFEAMAALGGLALIACVLGASPIIAVVAGSEYGGAIDVLRIQGGVLALTFVIVTWGYTLLAARRHRAVILSNVAALLVVAAGVLILAPSHGAKGAAIATVLSEASLAIGYGFAIMRIDPAMRPRLGRVSRLLLAVALAIAVGWLVPVPAVAATVIGASLYMVMLLLFRVVPDEILEHVPGPIAAMAGR